MLRGGRTEGEAGFISEVWRIRDTKSSFPHASTKKTKKQTRTQFKLVIPHCKKHHTVMNKSHFSFTGVSSNLSIFSLHCSIPEGVFVLLTFEFAALQQSSGLLQREKFLDGDKVVVHT